MREIVIRTEKRRAMDSDGKPLFKPRRTRLRAISWTERHAAQRTLYEAVTEYAREGYNRAMLEKKRHVGFLMVLLQRLVTSSTRAIRTALERRLEALEVPDDQLTLFSETAEEEWLDLDAQERIDALLASRLKAMKNERAEVKLLLAAARHAEEHRVREVIEEKLAVILDELGIDKTGDILDSAQAARIFDDLYVEAIARPGGLEAKAESVAEECLGIGVALSASRVLLGNSGSLDLGDTRSLMDHPLPHWVNLDGVELPGGDSWGRNTRPRSAEPRPTTGGGRRMGPDAGAQGPVDPQARHCDPALRSGPARSGIENPEVTRRRCPRILVAMANLAWHAGSGPVPDHAAVPERGRKDPRTDCPLRLGPDNGGAGGQYLSTSTTTRCRMRFRGR